MISEVLIVELSEHGSRSWYTDGDIVSGKVFINAKRDIGVRTITASLQCKELVKLDWKQKTREIFFVKQVSVPRFDTAEVEYVNMKEVLFPFSVMGKSVNSGGLTIRADVHEFDFSFKIPNLERIPPSWGGESSSTKVLWFVKVCVCKSGPHRDNERVLPIKVFQSMLEPPSGSIELKCCSQYLTVRLPGYKRGIAGIFNSDYKKKTWAQLLVSYPSTGISQSTYPSITISSDTPQPDLVMIQSVQVQLRSRAITSSHHHYYYEDAWHTLGEMDDVCFDDDGKVNITLLMIERGLWKLPLLPQAFRAQFFRIRYELVVYLRIEEKLRQDHKSDYGADLVVKVPCQVLSPSLTELPCYQQN